MPPVRTPLALAACLLTAAVAAAQGFTPDEAVKRMQLPDGFAVRCVASEPMIRQPVSIEFDDRGRLWVLQYLQYPNPAGLKPVRQDQYLRTVWDKVPEPPPRGPRGADRLTILYDPDEHGVYRKSKDFVGGLNLASGFCLGNGGVYVVQPPYLLYYPDRDGDDVPDGDPEVLLSGFGLDDTHSLANSLQWGPDGWLYGAAGSTSTCRIKNPAKPTDPPVEFQQGIWRYHPKTKEFELFSEGGGNTYGLDFDRNGQVIAGTNWGGFAMLHQLQGAYYVKGFSKHGPLHNPYTYGYFDHVPYKGFKGGHVTCGGILYQADAFPPEYRDQYVAGNLLSNAVYWHKLTPNGSTFTARHGGDLLVANDTWFRPVDLALGPDGSVYVADWYDKRAAHLDPIDNWDKTNGRVYRIEYKGTRTAPPFDLRKKSSAELVDLLKHPNAWWRREARRLLAERHDPATYPKLKKLIETETGTTALEAVWALYTSGGWSEEYAAEYLSGHPNPHVRAWYVRLVGDHTGAAVTSKTESALATMGTVTDPSPVVAAQLACTAKRLPAPVAKEILARLMARKEFDTDPLIPMLIWWAIESHMDADAAGMKDLLLQGGIRPANLARMERFARRAFSDGRSESRGALKEFARGLTSLPGGLKGLAAVARSGEMALDAGRITDTADLARFFVPLFKQYIPDDPAGLRFLAGLGDKDAINAVVSRVFERSPSTEAERAQWVSAAVRTKHLYFIDGLLGLLAEVKTDQFRIALLGAVESLAPAGATAKLLELYPRWSPAVRRKAMSVLLSRPAWALALFKAIDAGKFPKADVSLDQARAAVNLNDPAVTALVEKHFGKLAPATPGEKQARIAWLDLVMGRRGLGDPARGKALFAKHCAACHTLFGEGGKVGPDLTTADRKNRTYMLTQIVDPSGYIRPEFVAYKIDTADGRSLTGLVAESAGETVTVVTVADNQPQKTAVAKKDIDKMVPSPVSLMPEKLLDTLKDDEVRDLFAYLSSDEPKVKAGTSPAARPVAKKLKVCLVSGSLEYKSDESLAAFQKYLEANFPVECVRAFRKTDTDLPGLEQLETCDVAIFFTRRLKIDGEQLERVKKFVNSGKPVIGIRTASHGFQNWLEMDRLVFGGDYHNHYGAGPKCEVRVAEGAKDHPVLRGVKPFESAGSLYKNPNVAKDVTVLLTGTTPGHTEPVAWVRERKVGGRTQRVFYTSLGHMDDFKDPSFTRLLVNALAWTTGRELKPAGE